MTTRTQRQSSAGARTTCGTTDWHALEVQLNRTRTILQEILVHLQDVLKNLRMARPGASANAGTGRTDNATWRRTAQETRHTGTTQSRFRNQNTQQQAQYAHNERTQPPPHQGTTTTTGTSDRFRSRSRTTTTGPRAEAAGPRTTTSHERPQTEGARTFRTGTAGARTTTTAGSRNTTSGPFTTNRERPRTDNTTWRTKSTGATGSEREHRTTTRTTTTSQRPTARPSAEKIFHLDGERQRRAREAARKNGMNLKCAYDILCLDYPCSVDQIKCAYRHMARLHHPDLGGDEEAMKDVNVAYELAMRFSAGPRRASTAWAV